ncbi:LOW QUALITY PROTEIN: plexin domain-containing protein 1-like [Scylla paramamosain]|uniref:LOW QUALITY PROTEIN: plexin domain-containing protein 1-like n=1 Tax=Scylla paramamosain TaxID=85552 RepID=UPI003082716D
MASKGGGLVLFLTILTCYLLNAACGIDTGVVGPPYSVAGVGTVAGVEVRVLQRERRDVTDMIPQQGDAKNTTTTTTSTTTTTTPTTTTTTTPAPTKVEEEEKEEEEEEELEEEDDYNSEDMEEDSVGPVKGYETTNATVDHHRYYQSHTIKGVEKVQQYWVDLDSFEQETVITNKMLSASHRRAATVRLTFEFPFYGHKVRNITIATGGFLFTGDFIHTWLAATQYIAPLMANFDTSISKNASVKYADNGTSFTVQWNNVSLKDHADAGTFTFQVTLHKSGDIVFTYKEVPMFCDGIIDDQHPVKVGLSDAYIVDRTILFVRRKTIYEYHKIDMKKNSIIGNWTAILFKALPTCVSIHSCLDCLSQKISFQCHWCDSISRCSNGLDRNRQEWLLNNCEARRTDDVSSCPPPSAQPDPSPETFGRDASVESFTAAESEADGSSHVGVVIGVVFLVSLLMGVVGWITYAYFYPHSPSGQILIRYRPSTWSWRSGEARYTAAAIHSIHM